MIYEHLPDYQNKETIPFEILFLLTHTFDFQERWEYISFNNIEFYSYAPIWERFLIQLKNKDIRGYNSDVLDESTIIEYLHVYSEGFHEGYQGFDKVINSKVSVFSNKEEDIATKVFEFITTPNSFNMTNVVINQFEIESSYFTIDKNTWYKQGIDAGYHYKAWVNLGNFPHIFQKLVLRNVDFQKVYSSSLKVLEVQNRRLTLCQKLKTLTDNFKSTAHQENLQVATNNYNYSANPPILHLTNASILTRVYENFNNDLFVGDVTAFLKTFDILNYDNSTVKIKDRNWGKFYYLLDELYKHRSSEIDKYFPKKTLCITNILLKVDGNIASFQNRKVHNNSHSKFKKKVKEVLK